MKKNILLLFLFVFTIAYSEAYVLEIGDGTETSHNVPFNGSCYSLSHYILPVNELSTSMIIETLEFNFISTYLNSYSVNNQSVYMRLTNETTVTTTTPVNPIADNYTQVYVGSISWEGSGWKTIELTTPFVYDGVSNIEFFWENRSGSYGPTGASFYITQSNSAGIYGTSTYYEDHLYLSTFIDFYPNTRIGGCLSTMSPQPNEANISITPVISKK